MIDDPAHVVDDVGDVGDDGSVGSPGRTPLRRDAERNRARVLDAARVLFAQRGLSVSHDEIAQAADVGVGTVYRRFPTKADLIAVLFHGQVDQLVERAEVAAAGADPWGGLCAFLAEVVDLQAADKGLQQLMANADPAATADLAGVAQRRIGPIVADLLERARQMQQVRDDLTVEDVALIPVMIGAVSHRTSDVAPELRHRMLALVLRGAERLSSSTGTPFAHLPGPSLTADQLRRVLGRSDG